MAKPKAPVQPDLAELLISWELALRAERKSPETVKSYGDGVRAYLRWCATHYPDRPAVIDRRHLAGFVAALLTPADQGGAGAKPATAKSRQLAVRRFTAWLVEEDELDSNPLLGVKAPKLDTEVVEPLTEDELKRMLKACAGKDLRDRRDEAIIRFMAETGARAGEVVAMDLEDLNLTGGNGIVRRGKGGKGRIVPFGPQTARAVDRYLRIRRVHRLADTPDLWLGDRGKRFSYDALHKTLGMRADMAGIDGFHPHKLRHTMADRWLDAGGSEGGLMAVAGWSRPDMLLRYTAATRSARAADEARKLNLGDL